jgi:hypothetical protein
VTEKIKDLFQFVDAKNVMISENKQPMFLKLLNVHRAKSYRHEKLKLCVLEGIKFLDV